MKVVKGWQDSMAVGIFKEISVNRNGRPGIVELALRKTSLEHFCFILIG